MLRHYGISIVGAVTLMALAACSGGGQTGSGGASGTSSSAGTGAQGGGGQGAGGGGSPSKPADLVSYLSGDDADKDVAPQGPGLILMGGGVDVDDAFVWWKPLLAGGDVVVLRASGSDGYNDYLYAQIGGADSVETLMVTSKALAESDYVAWRVSHAEGVFIAGGDQAVYVEMWKGTALASALQAAWARGAVIGGTSAGCAVLGEVVFAATNGTVYSDEALADPYNVFMALDRDFLAFPPLQGTVMDTHFAERDRMGRLVAFVARMEKDGWASPAQGIGVNEETALVVGPNGQGTVLGNGAVYLVRPTAPPVTCEAAKPLEYPAVPSFKLVEGDTVTLPFGPTMGAALALSASMGVLSPPNPY